MPAPAGDCAGKASPTPPCPPSPSPDSSCNPPSREPASPSPQPSQHWLCGFGEPLGDRSPPGAYQAVRRMRSCRRA
jgi:hypothetical protein